MTVVEICAQVWKWKNETYWNYSRNGGGVERRTKENDGGDKIQLRYIAQTFVNIAIYPQYNNKKRKKTSEPDLDMTQILELLYKYSLK
jgi:hypothetical protein